MRIGVIGGGTVGRATARCWLEHVEEVRVYDRISERKTHALEDVLACDLVFVCLPEDSLDRAFSCYLNLGFKDTDYVIKSTVKIGTTRALSASVKNLVHSPEFLTSRCAMTDAQMPARNIIGIPGYPSLGKPLLEHETMTDPGEAVIDCDWSLSEGTHQLYSLCRRRFPGVEVHLMSSDESEAVKLFQNSFFATKVSFWNECRALSDHLGLDWERVMAAVLADGRISHSHTRVPGHDGFGFGGGCLVKDLKMLEKHLLESGLTAPHAPPSLRPEITSAVLRRNEHDRRRKA